MVAVLGVYMPICQKGKSTGSWGVHRAMRMGGLGIPLWEKMNDTVDVRCVTNVAYAHFYLHELFKSFRWKGKAWAFRQMIYQGVGFSEIHGMRKKFHTIVSMIKRE